MKRYDEYIEINSPWIKNIPMNWNAKRLKSVAAYISRGETPVYTDDTSCTKVINQATFSQGYWNTKKVRYTSSSPIGNESVPKQRDILLASTGRGVLGKVFYFDQSDTYIADSHVTIIRTCKTLNSRFLYYYLSVHFDTINGLLARGSTNQTELQEYSLKNMPVPIPSADEQDQIVRYLDWQVSKINRLIAAKRKEIALLHEQHKRRISEAVLHGNDDGCCQKDSGVEWIGMIPEHWSVIRCKYVFTERDERSIAGEEEHLSMSQKYGLVPDSKLDERRMLSESYVGGKVCYKNDLVLNRLKAHLGVFALSPQKGVISPDYTVLIPSAERILPTYGEAVLKNDLCRRELRIRVRGIIEGFWRLYTDDFSTIVIPLPPLKEQEQIMKHLSALNNKFTALKQRLEQEINILHELRTRLISDVVTGQIDVRGIKVPDDEYINNEITEEEFEEESENNEEE